MGGPRRAVAVAIGSRPVSAQVLSTLGLMTSAGDPLTEATDPSLKRAARFALGGAVCALVPIPLLDDLLLARTRRRLVREVAKSCSVSLTRDQVYILAESPRKGFWGCGAGVLFSIFVRLPLKLLRRILRTVLFFLAARDASAKATKMFHESYLLELGIGELRKESRGGPITEDRAVLLRTAISATWNEIDPSPIRQTVSKVLQSSLSGLRGAGRSLARATRRRGRSEEPPMTESASGEETKPILDRLIRALSVEDEYVAELGRVFQSKWSATDESPIPPPG